MRCSDTSSIKMRISFLMEQINKGSKTIKNLENPLNESQNSLQHPSSYRSPQIALTPNKNIDSSAHLLSKASKPLSNLAQQMKAAYMKDSARKVKEKINRPSESPSLARARSEQGIIQSKIINKVEKFKTSLEQIQEKISFYSRRNKVQQKFSPEKQNLANKTSPSPARPFLGQKAQKCKELCLKLKKKLLKETVSTTTTQILKQEMSIEEFSLGRLLGQGKFSRVYLARHIKTGMILALKIIKKETILRQKFQDQLARQIVIQSFFNHVNIVRLYGYFHDQTNVYLLQEYCTAGQLYDIFKVKSKLKEEDWRPIMKGICEGLYELHLNDVIHRDIKPENIMMAFGLPKIGDFGWTVYSPHDRRDTFCGTPLYISPQLLLAGSYGKQVDIWALGVMMFQFLTGRIPFKIDQQKKLLQIVNSKIEIPQNLSPSCKQLMSMVLNKDPQSRIAIPDVLQHQFLGNTLTGSISQPFFITQR